MKLSLALIETNGGTQPRLGINWDTVDQYAADMAGGAQFPPVVVFYDGEKYWLSSGFHRVNAARKAGFGGVEADVRQGTQQDAQWYSYSANKEFDTSGNRRTTADKQNAIRTALSHPKANTLSNRAVAEHCGVSEFMVRSYKDSICDKNADSSQLEILPLEDGGAPQSLAFPVDPVVREIEVKRGDSSYTMKVSSAPRTTQRDKLASQISPKTVRAIEGLSTFIDWADFALENRKRMETEDSPSFRINMMDQLKVVLKWAEEDEERAEFVSSFIPHEVKMEAARQATAHRKAQELSEEIS